MYGDGSDVDGSTLRGEEGFQKGDGLEKDSLHDDVSRVEGSNLGEDDRPTTDGNLPDANEEQGLQGSTGSALRAQATSQKILQRKQQVWMGQTGRQRRQQRDRKPAEIQREVIP